MITLETLEQSLEDLYFHPYEARPGEEPLVGGLLLAEVCCLAVEIEEETLHAEVIRSWFEGPDISGDFKSYVFEDKTQIIASYDPTELDLRHAERHGFEKSALAAVNVLFLAYEAKYYGACPSDLCPKDLNDESWIRFFLLYLPRIANDDCDCAIAASKYLENVREYAEELGVTLER